MIKFIQILIVIGLTSLSVFPFFFSFLPSVNTKMMLAVWGIVLFYMDHLNGYTKEFEKSLFVISMWALGVSFCSYISMTVNSTPDDSYLGYIISMLVWLFAAYFCVSLMRRVHGYISVEIVGYYLVGIALLQCTLGLLIHSFPFIKGLTDTYITGEGYMGVGVKDRLYGIGCALDVGGGRLGAILIVIVYLLLQTIKQNRSVWQFAGLVAAFIYIVVIGNMMGRTASVGAGIALVYLLGALLFDKSIYNANLKSYLNSAFIVLFSGIIVCVGLYNFNSEARNLLRFGFEAFFNYFEYGEFETNSTNMLSEGMIFPDNLHTWIIGDGYMASGSNDPYYIGPADYGFYMNTDAGYSRFIFYFGLIGISVFALFFVNACRECINRFQDSKFLFIAILLFNFCVWIKVSTDLFVMLAPFLCISSNPKEENNNSLVS